MAATALFAICVGNGARAAEADDAALPVRKASANKATGTAKEPASKTDKGKSSTSAKPASKTGSTSKSSKSGTAKTTAGSGSSKSSANKSASTKTSAKPATKSEDEVADPDAIALPVRSNSSAPRRDQKELEDSSSRTPSDSTPIDLPEPQVTGTALQQSTVTAPPTQPIPNTYTGPGTTPGSGFFRRLFNRQPNTQTSAQQFQFNSDYATRAANAMLPSVLPGFGLGGADLPIGGEDTYRLSTLPTDFRPTDLVLMPKEYSYYGNPIYLRNEAAHSLARMFNDAAKQGLTLKLFSGYRDYQHQQRLYAQAVSRNRNQNTVARPGKSEHQLGTTADVTNSSKYLMKRSFADTPEGKWLMANASRYGWKMTVLRGSGPRSHADEPWHIRYLGANVNSPQVAQQNYQYPQQQPRRSIFSRIGGIFGRRS